MIKNGICFCDECGAEMKKVHESWHAPDKEHYCWCCVYRAMLGKKTAQ